MVTSILYKTAMAELNKLDQQGTTSPFLVLLERSKTQANTWEARLISLDEVIKMAVKEVRRTA